MSGSTWPAQYEIRVEEAVDGRWSTWFEGLEARRGAGETIIFGSLADESAVHGVLAKYEISAFASSPFAVWDQARKKVEAKTEPGSDVGTEERKRIL